MLKVILNKIKERQQKKKGQQFFRKVDQWQQEMYLYKLQQERAELDRLNKIH